MVTTTLKRPVAIRSISSSICCSVDDGEFRSVYEENGCVVVEGPAAALGAEAGGALTGGRIEKREGEGEMNERYWSNTCKHSICGYVVTVRR